MSALSNPYFWAMLSLLGMLGGNTIADRTKVGTHRFYGIAVIALVLLPRFIIPLNFIEQTRFELPYQNTIGVGLIIVAICLWVPLYRIVWATSPNKNEVLTTSGVFSFVRHPGYLGDVLIVLGWSILFGSVVGVALTPLWLAAFYLHSLVEENSLIAEYGDHYNTYKSRVRARIIPWVPF